MTRGPDLSISPETFDPERSLDGEGNLRSSSVNSISFVFGRRSTHTWVLDDQLLTHTHQTFLTLIVCKVCLDLCFADKSITVVIATILYCFEVGKAKNSNVGIGPAVDFDGLIKFGRES